MAFHLRYFQAGQFIFHEGEASDRAYIIEKGSVDILAADNQEVIHSLSAGELFGEMGVLDQSVRSTAARAKTKVTLLEIKPGQITDRLTDTDPIIQALIGVLLKRLRALLPKNGEQQNDDLLSHVASVIEQSGLSKFRLESELRTAVNSEKVQTVFQPIVDLNTHKVAGFEALSRWFHPKLGVISPFEFITLAEETDMIIEVGSLVFSRAIDLLSQLPESVFISINVSAKQLNSAEFLPALSQRLKNQGINPARLKLEITETMMVDINQAASWIDRCHQAGFLVCADDFGTGYSGLRQLLDLPFDVLKIDQVFIQSVLSNPVNITLVETMVSLAKKLNIQLVAEGIEDKSQHQLLKDMSVDYGQGYYYGKAISIPDILAQKAQSFKK
ncbi:MAG: EAL domain-containing protein [Marinicella pacifica]